MLLCCMYKLYLYLMYGIILFFMYKFVLFLFNLYKKCYFYKKFFICMKDRIEDIFILYNINIILLELVISNFNWNEMCIILE